VSPNSGRVLFQQCHQSHKQRWIAPLCHVSEFTEYRRTRGDIFRGYRQRREPALSCHQEYQNVIHANNVTSV
jgi:hypothetical protein